MIAPITLTVGHLGSQLDSPASPESDEWDEGPESNRPSSQRPSIKAPTAPSAASSAEIGVLEAKCHSFEDELSLSDVCDHARDGGVLQLSSTLSGMLSRFERDPKYLAMVSAFEAQEAAVARALSDAESKTDEPNSNDKFE